MAEKRKGKQAKFGTSRAIKSPGHKRGRYYKACYQDPYAPKGVRRYIYLDPKFETKSAADAALAAIDRDIQAGRWVHPDELKAQAEAEQERAKRRAYTIGEWRKEWLAALERAAERGESSYNTDRTYYNITNKWVKEWWDDVAFNDVTRERVLAWYEMLKQQKSITSAYTVINIYSAWRAMWLAAKRAGKITSVDVAIIEGASRKPKKNKRKSADELPTDEQIWAMIDYAVPFIGFYIAIARYCGLRDEEIAGLRRKDLVLTGERPYVSVERAVARDRHGKMRESFVKSDSSFRVVPLAKSNKRLINFLNDYLLNHVEPDQDARLLHVPGTPPDAIVSNNHVRRGKRRFNDARDHVGIAKTFTPHSVRHLFAIRLRQKGVIAEEVRDLLGHTSLEITDIYIDVEDARLRRAMEIDAEEANKDYGDNVTEIPVATVG